MTSLPIILVSAKTKAAASHIISELIENEPPPEEGNDTSGDGRIWHLQNKYYTADVCLLPTPDGEPSPHKAPEGHIIYLAEDECTVEIASAREEAGAEAEVRVLVAECPELPVELAAWAARKCFEPVPLREPPSSEDEDENLVEEPRGVAAARAALHAHAWPGLRLHGVRHKSESGSEEDVERAEQWAAALGTLGGAARAVRQLPSTERRQAAEQLVAAFCRALGENLDTL